MALDVVIPVKDRSEILLCARSLLASGSIRQVIVCDGGSTDAQCLEGLNQLRQQGVCVLTIPHSGFNKSKLINQGILQSRSEFVLVSDADIVWNRAALNALLEASAGDRTICHIRDVEESEPQSNSLRRDRYTYSINSSAEGRLVSVAIDAPQPNKRPGCGLICARRSTLLELGGYKEIFRGWGWEDQDLLIRATLLGMQICTAGSVLHLSHTDAKRNCHHANLTPQQTRNQNIVTCLNDLAAGHLWGHLTGAIAPSSIPCRIRVQYPAALTTPFCADGCI